MYLCISTKLEHISNLLDGNYLYDKLYTISVLQLPFFQSLINLHLLLNGVNFLLLFAFFSMDCTFLRLDCRIVAMYHNNYSQYGKVVQSLIITYQISFNSTQKQSRSYVLCQIHWLEINIKIQELLQYFYNWGAICVPLSIDTIHFKHR